MRRLIIFTDLDGTLLDHDTYAWQPAAAALERIRTLGVPLILNSSKTVAEIEQLRRELDNSDPFIVENGGAVCLPGPGQSLTRHRFGKPYAEIVAILDQMRSQERFRFKGFSDMTDSELADRTGLDRNGVVLAKQRDCSEPLVWEDSESNFGRFVELLQRQTLQVVRGGRFCHVMGATDKGRAMNWVLDHYRQAGPDTDFVAVALGDSENDRPMLEAADYAVVIRPARGDALRLSKTDHVIYTEEKGPTGWQHAIDRILDQRGE